MATPSPGTRCRSPGPGAARSTATSTPRSCRSRPAPDELAARAAESEAALRAVVGRLEDAWEEEWLPEITARLRAMEAADPRGVPSTVGLVDVLEGYWEHMERLWELHFEVVFAAYVAVSDFADLHRDLFGGDDFDVYRLLQGTPTRTFEVGLRPVAR